MKKYLSFFRIRFIAGLQYRAAAWAGMVTQVAWGSMTLLMFWAFYQGGKEQFPMTFSELSSYIWMQQAFLAMFMAWFFDNDLFESITTGSIAYELCRPCDLYTMWFIKNMAIRLSRTALRSRAFDRFLFARAVWLVAAAKRGNGAAVSFFSDSWLPGADILFHADLYFRFLHDFTDGNTDPRHSDRRIFRGFGHAHPVFPQSAAAGFLQPAVCFHEEHAVFDLCRASGRRRSAAAHCASAFLVCGAADRRPDADETGAEKSRRAGGIRHETLYKIYWDAAEITDAI